MASETQNYGYPKPEEEDFYNVGDFNQAMDMIDKDMKDANDAILGINDQMSDFEQAEERENISPGDGLRVRFGKIKKFFADLKQVAFTGSYNDLSNKPTIPEAVRVKGNAETTYHTGDVNITPANIGLGDVGNFKAVSTASQTLSETEKSNARANIGAAPTSHASTAATYGASSSTNYGHAMASSTTPKANGTAAAGAETTKFARGDHVHPLQTSVTGSSGSCTGNAATATVATKAMQDGNGNNIANTYLTKTGKAASAVKADSATKATEDGNGYNIANTYVTKDGNAWKKIKTIAYNADATVSKNVYKDIKIVAYVAGSDTAVVHHIYDFPLSVLDNVPGNTLDFGDVSRIDTYFYVTLNGNTAIVENSYKGMTIEVYAK